MRTNVGGIARRAALAGVFLWCGLGGAARAGNLSYVYDRGDRLLAAFDGNGNYANYQYDMAGNITAIVRGGASGVAVFGYSPDEGSAVGGAQVTIYGLNFSSTASQNTVTSGLGTWTVLSSTTTAIVAKEPNITSGPSGQNSPACAITVTSPSGTATGPCFYTY